MVYFMKLLSQIEQLDYESSLEPALQKIEQEFGVFLTVHDLRGRLHYGDGSPLLPGRNIHQHVCCMRMRDDIPNWNTNCGEDCFRQTEETANILQKPFLKSCWKGIVELVVPIFVREQHMITILAGTFRHPDGIPEHADLPQWLHDEYAKLPLFDLEKIENLSYVLRLIGNGMITWKENALARKELTGRKLQIYQFIEDHAHEDISLADLSRAIGLSSSRTRHLVKELTNRPFKSLIEEERMLRAGYLLQSTGNTLDEIAEAIGYKNCYYFNRVFKNYFGVPPGAYRRELKKRQIDF